VATRRGIVLGLAITAGTFAVGAAAGRRVVSLPKGTTRFRDSIDIPATAFGVLPADGPSGPHVIRGFITEVSGGDTLRVRHTPLRPPGSSANDPDSYFHRRGLPRSDPAALPRPSDETLAIHLAGVHCPETGRWGMPGQALADDARRFVTDLLVARGGGSPGGVRPRGGGRPLPRGAGATVRLGLAARDGRERLVAAVWVGPPWEAVDLAAELLSAGLAVCTRSLDGAPTEGGFEYARLEADAKAQGLGVWRVSAAGETPSRQRTRMRAGDARGG